MILSKCQSAIDLICRFNEQSLKLGIYADSLGMVSLLEEFQLLSARLTKEGDGRLRHSFRNIFLAESSQHLASPILPHIGRHRIDSEEIQKLCGLRVIPFLDVGHVHGKQESSVDSAGLLNRLFSHPTV